MSDTVVEEAQDAEPTDFTIGSDADAIHAAEEMGVETGSGAGKAPPSLRAHMTSGSYGRGRASRCWATACTASPWRGG